MNMRSPLCPSICTAAVAPGSGTANAPLASSASCWMSADDFERRRSHLTRYIRWRTLHPSRDSGTNGLCITALWLGRRSASRDVNVLGFLLLRTKQLDAEPVARIRKNLVHRRNHE